MFGCDGISELPDSLLTHILSYLPTKDAVKTSLLSKSWRYLWLEVTSKLDLNAVDFLRYEDDSSLARLMNRSFLRKLKIKYESPTRIKKMKRKRCEDSPIVTIYGGKRVMEWIAEAVHRGVEHVDVEHETFKLPIFDFIPKCLYVSQTLVSLRLVNVALEDPKFEVSLPCLKSIQLDNIYYSGADVLMIMEMLISGSPVLENFTTDVPVLTKLRRTVFREVPWCLECVKINKLTMKSELTMKNELTMKRREYGIELVNYFLENSAALKKMTLSFRDADMASDEEAESYKNLLTSTRLSPMCQIYFVYFT